MIKIKRWYLPEATVGRLTLGEFRCFTLELPDKGNAPNVSCIPPGTYKAFKRVKPSGVVIQLEGVPGRSGIQMHAGNFTRQILGCILPGDGIKDLDSDTIPDVTNSEPTLRKILALLPDRFEITIE